MSVMREDDPNHRQLRRYKVLVEIQFDAETDREASDEWHESYNALRLRMRRTGAGVKAIKGPERLAKFDRIC